MMSLILRSKWLNRRVLLLLLLYLVLLAFPTVVKNPYYVHVVIFTLMYVVLAQAWNLIGGYAGQVALGSTVFFGIGAYTSTLLLLRMNITPWLGMWIGAILAAGVSLALGYPIFRLKGHYFAMATLALGEITRICFSNWEFVEGARGISLPIHIPSWYYMEWKSKQPYYYIILFLAALVTILVSRLHKTRFGMYAKAAKEDELAARSRGLNTFKVKQTAFALSAIIMALAGTFYAQYIMYISPSAILLLMISIQIAVIVIIGGRGEVLGPIFGAVVILPLTEFLRVRLGGQAMGLNYIVFGLAIIFVALVEPLGFVALMARLRHGIKAVGQKLGDAN